MRKYPCLWVMLITVLTLKKTWEQRRLKFGVKRPILLPTVVKLLPFPDWHHVKHIHMASWTIKYESRVCATKYWDIQFVKNCSEWEIYASSRLYPAFWEHLFITLVMIYNACNLPNHSASLQNFLVYFIVYSDSPELLLFCRAWCTAFVSLISCTICFI